jgi:hypothetical protein
MGGFHLVVEVAARDVAGILEANRVHVEVRREVNNKLLRLLRVCSIDKDVTRTNANDETNVVCNSIINDIVDHICNTEIPRSMVADRERHMSTLQQELAASQHKISQLEIALEKAQSSIHKGEAARDYLMGCYFHEVLQLRQQLQSQEAKTAVGSPSRTVKGAGSQRRVWAASSGGEETQQAGSRSPSTESLAVLPRSDASGGVVNAVFDYTKYISLAETTVVSWPDRYAALELRMEETIAKIQADCEFQIADMTRITDQREITIRSLRAKISSLEHTMANMNPLVNQVISNIAAQLRQNLEKIRMRVDWTNEQVTEMFAKVQHHVASTDGRVACLVRFVRFCTQRIKDVLCAVLRGEPLSVINGKPLWQYFLISGDDDPQMEAKAFWQEHSTMSEIVNQFKSVLLVIEEFSSKTKRPSSIAVEVFSELMNEDGLALPKKQNGPSEGDPSVSTGGTGKAPKGSSKLPKTPTKKGPSTPGLKQTPAAASAAAPPEATGAGGSEALKALAQAPSPATLKKLTDTLHYFNRKSIQLIIHRVNCRARRKVILDRLPPFLRNLVVSITTFDRDITASGLELDRVRSKGAIVAVQLRQLQNMLGKGAALADARKSSVSDRKGSTANSGGGGSASVPASPTSDAKRASFAPLDSPLTPRNKEATKEKAEKERGIGKEKVANSKRPQQPASSDDSGDENEIEDDATLVPPPPSHMQLQSKLANLLKDLEAHKKANPPPPPPPPPPAAVLPPPVASSLPPPISEDIMQPIERSAFSSPIDPSWSPRPPEPLVVIQSYSATSGSAPQLVQSTTKSLADRSAELYMHAASHRRENTLEIDNVTSAIVAHAEAAARSSPPPPPSISLPNIPTAMPRMPVMPSSSERRAPRQQKQQVI